jgi:hypothetical protein
MKRDFDNQLFILNILITFLLTLQLLEGSTFVSSFLLLGAKRLIGNGQCIIFWLDIWHHDYRLSVYFSLVYAKFKSFSISSFGKLKNSIGIVVILEE